MQMSTVDSSSVTDFILQPARPQIVNTHTHCTGLITAHHHHYCRLKKDKGSPYSITERRVPELIPVLGSQPAGDVSHKPGGRLPLLSARHAVTPATLKRAATNFAAWRMAQWV